MAAIKNKNIKPGWRSTEFILSTLVALLGIAVAGGFVDLGGATTTDKIAGLVASALAAVGYSLGRSKVKAAAEENK